MRTNTSRPTFLRTAIFAAIAVLAAVSLLAAACSSDDDSAPTPTAAAASASGTASSGALVTVHMDTKFGQILATADGLPLYTFNGDTQGKSNCTGECLDEWPPLTTTASSVPPVAGASGTFSLVKRDDGSMQVAYNGMPLYTFTDDKAGGAATGDGEDDFSIATTAGAASTTTTDTGAGGGYNY